MGQTQNQQEHLLTPEEAAAYMRCSRVFLWKKRKEGKLKYLAAGRKVLFRKEDIDSFLAVVSKEEVING